MIDTQLHLVSGFIELIQSWSDLLIRCAVRILSYLPLRILPIFVLLQSHLLLLLLLPLYRGHPITILFLPDFQILKLLLLGGCPMNAWLLLPCCGWWVVGAFILLRVMFGEGRQESAVSLQLKAVIAFIWDVEIQVSVDYRTVNLVAVHVMWISSALQRILLWTLLLKGVVMDQSLLMNLHGFVAL